MQILVEMVRGQPSVALTMDELRSAIVAGRVQGFAQASLDGGQTWMPAWRASGLPPPMGPDPSNDAALRMLVPIGRSGWAIAAGYLAIPTLLADVIWLPMSMGAKMTAGEAAAAGGISLLCLGVLPVAAGLLGQRAIRKDPSKTGMGRVGFAYVCVGLLVLAVLVAVARGAAGH